MSCGGIGLGHDTRVIGRTQRDMQANQRITRKRGRNEYCSEYRIWRLTINAIEPVDGGAPRRGGGSVATRVCLRFLHRIIGWFERASTKRWRLELDSRWDKPTGTLPIGATRLMLE